MNDLRDQISIGCAVNVAIINDVQKTGDFRSSCVNVPLKHNIVPPVEGAEWPFQNMSWEAYMMYCLLVVPKELYNLSKDDEFYKNLAKKNVMRKFHIKKERESFSESPFYHFNSLRNSVSHVNYTLSKNNVLRMWDHPHRKPEEEFWHWEIEVSKTDMHSFLGEMAEAVFAIYNETKSGIRNQKDFTVLKK